MDKTTRIECVGRWHDEVEDDNGVVSCTNCEWTDGKTEQDARIRDNVAQWYAGESDDDLSDLFEDRDPAEFF